MNNLLTTFHLIFAILIIVFVLLQAQGTGLGSTWGGGGETYHTRRGVEKVVFYLTIAVIALFTLTSVLSIMI